MSVYIIWKKHTEINIPILLSIHLNTAVRNLHKCSSHGESESKHHVNRKLQLTILFDNLEAVTLEECGSELVNQDDSIREMSYA